MIPLPARQQWLLWIALIEVIIHETYEAIGIWKARYAHIYPASQPARGLTTILLQIQTPWCHTSSVGVSLIYVLKRSGSFQSYFNVDLTKVTHFWWLCQLVSLTFDTVVPYGCICLLELEVHGYVQGWTKNANFPWNKVKKCVKNVNFVHIFRIFCK